MPITRLGKNELSNAAITSTSVVSSQSAMLALTAEHDDMCIRTDISKTYVLMGSNVANLADWQELLSSQAYDETGVAFGTSPTTIDSYDKTVFRTAKYVIQVSNSSAYQSSEVVVNHDGTSAYDVVYATLSSIGTAFATFSSNIVGSNVELYATGLTSGNTAKIQKTYIKV
jgi:trimeric autotransporter adhesin